MKDQDYFNMLYNLQRTILSGYDYIAKYDKWRKVHAEILENMWNYINAGKYDMDYYLDLTEDSVNQELLKYGSKSIFLDLSNQDDATIFTELLVYPNHPDIVPLTSIYLEKNKFRNLDKVKFLQAMNDSYVSLFKVIDTDLEHGYVTYEDVFTGKKYQVIDISQSLTLKVDKSNLLYFYNRLITIDDITFGTGLHCAMYANTPGLQEFIKKYKKSKCSDFARCLYLYNLCKQNNTLKMRRNTKYGK